jgi:hypothetical protein
MARELQIPATTLQERIRKLEEKGDADLDGQFIFLWIAFNATYANEIQAQYRPYTQENQQALYSS